MELRSLTAAMIFAVSSSLTAVAAPDDASVLRASLRTVKGQVIDISLLPGEGNLSVLAAEVDSGSLGSDTVTVLLAPRVALEQLELIVERGDIVQARVFVGEPGPLKAHTFDNLTRDTTVRLRTLHKFPLWDAQGNWFGGRCRGRGHGSGHRHQGR